jgi:hypothetical protein
LCKKHYAQWFRKHNPESGRSASRKWRRDNAEKVNSSHREYYSSNPDRVKVWQANSQKHRDEERDQLKLETLSHYGRDGKAQCCWEGCTEKDIDVLTLDHLYNDGKAHRKAEKVSGGSSLYRRLRKQGMPSGFQTLCMNHQFKKELMRKRTEKCQ